MSGRSTHDKRKWACQWLVNVLLVFVLWVDSAYCEDCPPCQQPNPNYDPNLPYPDEQSEPKCIPKDGPIEDEPCKECKNGEVSNKPRDTFDSKQKEAACPDPILDGVAKMGEEFGFTDPGTLKFDLDCASGCDGSGNLKYKMIGDVNADIVIKVYTENEVKGHSFSQCGLHGLFDTRRRTDAMIKRTKVHEQVHCKAFINALLSLKKAIKDSPLRETSDECEEDMIRFKLKADKLWSCIITREHNHCSHAKENSYKIDICGEESEDGPRVIGPCPDCS